MSKKRGVKSRLPGKRPRITRKRLAAALSLCLAAAGVAATRSPSARYAVGSAPLAESAPQQVPQPLSLAKEYVYAGGRLVATEEPTPSPTPAPAGPTPTNLVAALASVDAPSASVTVTWAAPSSAVLSYVVERTSAGGQYAPVGRPVAVPVFTDTTAAEGAAYLYRVRAVYAGGVSGYSNADLATAVAYTDDPLIGANDPQGRRPTKVYARHLTELRRAVDAVRALAGQGGAAWKDDPAPRAGGRILAAHFAELRANLRPALAALGLVALPDDPTLDAGRRVKVAHVQDVRDKVR